MRSSPLSRLISALPQADGVAARLRRCAVGALRRGWAGQATNMACTMEIGRQSAIPAEALVALVGTAAGNIGLAMLPHQWPALASAATLPDRQQRSAVAALLLGRCIGPLAQRILSVDLRENAAAASFGSGVVLHCDGARIDVLAADEVMLATLESELHASGTAVAVDPSFMSRLRLPSRILLGARCIAPASLRRLRTRDVVLLPISSSPDAAAPHSAVLIWGNESGGRLQARVLLQNSIMTIIDAPVTAAADDSPDLEPSATSRAIARLELPVRFELAGPLLSLADISGLRANDLLELGLPLDQARVRISVAGQLIGLGELVAVGKRLGVRVVQLDHAADEEPSP